MTYEYINELLQQQGENPVLLEGCVLNITDGRSIIYSLWGDTDYEQRELEICYADNHSDVIWKGVVKTKQELEFKILESIKLKTANIKCETGPKAPILFDTIKESEDYISRFKKLKK